MKRFIRYLYEYARGQRQRNVGFVKVEMETDRMTVHVQGKGLTNDGNENVSIALLCREQGILKSIPITEGVTAKPAVSLQFCFSPDFTEECGKLSDCEAIVGILLREPDNENRMIALWDEALWGSRIPEEIPGICAETPAEEKSAVEELPPKNFGTKEAALEKSGAEELPSESPDEVAKTTKPEHVHVTKIQRRELSILPRCEWRLANNNFLMHGYYNYRHLVLIDDGEQLKLGVPGIYHEKEAKAASAFGFDEFVSEADTGLTLEAEEHPAGQTFGYWCRHVKRPVSY